MNDSTTKFLKKIMTLLSQKRKEHKDNMSKITNKFDVFTSHDADIEIENLTIELNKFGIRVVDYKLIDNNTTLILDAYKYYYNNINMEKDLSLGCYPDYKKHFDEYDSNHNHNSCEKTKYEILTNPHNHKHHHDKHDHHKHCDPSKAKKYLINDEPIVRQVTSKTNKDIVKLNTDKIISQIKYTSIAKKAEACGKFKHIPITIETSIEIDQNRIYKFLTDFAHNISINTTEQDGLILNQIRKTIISFSIFSKDVLPFIEKSPNGNELYISYKEYKDIKANCEELYDLINKKYGDEMILDFIENCLISNNYNDEDVSIYLELLCHLVIYLYYYNNNPRNITITKEVSPEAINKDILDSEEDITIPTESIEYSFFILGNPNKKGDMLQFNNTIKETTMKISRTNKGFIIKSRELKDIENLSYILKDLLDKYVKEKIEWLK